MRLAADDKPDLSQTCAAPSCDRWATAAGALGATRLGSGRTRRATQMLTWGTAGGRGGVVVWAVAVGGASGMCVCVCVRVRVRVRVRVLVCWRAAALHMWWPRC